MKSIKGLAVAALAVAALAAVPAAASANGLHIGGTKPILLQAKTYPYTPTGERLESEGLVGQITLLKVADNPGGNSRVSCTNAQYVGEKLTDPTIEFALYPTYSGCKVGGTEVTVSSNGCYYHYETFQFIATGSYSADIDFVCPGEPLLVQIPGCKITIPGQSLTGGTLLPFENVVFGGEEKIIGAITASSVKYTTNSGISCKLAGFQKAFSGEDGTTQQEMLLRAL